MKNRKHAHKYQKTAAVLFAVLLFVLCSVFSAFRLDTASAQMYAQSEAPDDSSTDTQKSNTESELSLPTDGTEEAVVPDGASELPSDEASGLSSSDDSLSGESSVLTDENDFADEKSDTAFLAAGEITIDNVVYWCYENGEAAIRNASKATGAFMVPKEITGAGGGTYKVTKIEGYTSGGRDLGAFQGSSITSLSFEAGSELYYIREYAFSACYGLSGSSITLPDTITYIGNNAFAMYADRKGLDELRHPHIAQVSGSLPDLTAGDPLPVPDEALQHESTVDSSVGNTVLHKGAKWLNEELTEAEIRIDFSQYPNYNGKVDFVFVMDYSVSMLASAPVTTPNGTSGSISRSLLTNDVVYGVSQILLDSGQPGYDNRVAMVAFGGGIAPVWTSDFTSSSYEVEETLFKNPLTLDDSTSYGTGLQGAIDLISARKDKSRTAVVIFLSDGSPNVDYGTAQAKTLRNMGVKVYPIAIYTPVNSYLRAISYDSMTAYGAQDTESFETIIMEVAEEIIEQDVPLDTKILDVISDWFEPLTGTDADITVSPDGGTAALTGDTVTWDLTGTASDRVHNILIRVRLKSGTETTASGLLPTNSAMQTEDGSIISDAQPQLERYNVHHLFENGSDPEQPLPDEVLALLPKSTGGYRTGTVVTPEDPDAFTVETAAGEVWEFTTWVPADDLIVAHDVTFTGIWKRTSASFAFIKTDSTGNPLPGAEFDLYLWQGENEPADENQWVTAAGTAPDQWVKVNRSPLISGGDGSVQLQMPSAGLYQLVETASPGGYAPAGAQWRFTAEDGQLTSEPVSIPLKDAADWGDFAKVTENGTETWQLPNYRMADIRFIKASSVHYHDGETSAEALQGARFELYIWLGEQPPGDTELVNDTTVQAGLWRLAGKAESLASGDVSFSVEVNEKRFYQLMEISAPENYNLPAGQWRFRLKPDGSVDTASIQSIAGADGTIPPPLSQAVEGPFTGELVLINIPDYEMPSMGGPGTLPLLLAGVGLCTFSGFIGFGMRFKKRSASKRSDYSPKHRVQ